jgi:hypothetical protein
MLKSGTIHGITGIIPIYKVEPSVWDFFLEEGSQDQLGTLLCTKGTYCARRRGIILVESTEIRRFLRGSGRGGWSFYWRPRVSKLTQRGLSGSSPLRSEGSCHSQEGGWPMSMEANLRATFSEVRSNESWKAMLDSQIIIKQQARGSLRTESTYSLSCRVLVKGELKSMKGLC